MLAFGFTEDDINEINANHRENQEAAKGATEEGDGTRAAQGQDQDFGLTGETAEEVKAKEAEQDATAKAERDAADKDEAEAKKKRIAAEVASRQKASAENFALGQDAEVRAMIHTFLATTKQQFPQLDAYSYDFNSSQFVDRSGRPVGTDRFADAAGLGVARASRAGQATVRRAIFLQSLVSSDGSARPGILENVLTGGRSFVSQGGLKAVFSRSDAEYEVRPDTTIDSPLDGATLYTLDASNEEGVYRFLPSIERRDGGGVVQYGEQGEDGSGGGELDTSTAADVKNVNDDFRAGNGREFHADLPKR